MRNAADRGDPARRGGGRRGQRGADQAQAQRPRRPGRDRGALRWPPRRARAIEIVRPRASACCGRESKGCRRTSPCARVLGRFLEHSRIYVVPRRRRGHVLHRQRRPDAAQPRPPDRDRRAGRVRSASAAGAAADARQRLHGQPQAWELDADGRWTRRSSRKGRAAAHSPGLADATRGGARPPPDGQRDAAGRRRPAGAGRSARARRR